MLAGEVVIQVSEDGTSWTDSLGHEVPVNYLRISYDGGTTWKHTLNLTGKNDWTITFTIDANAYKPVAQGGWTDSGDDDYNKMINLRIIFKRHPIWNSFGII